MERFVIYGLTEPNHGELRYIGKSVTGAAQRLSSHLCPSSLLGRTHKEKWVKSLLKRGEKPEIFVIEACGSKEELNEAERHHIAYFRSIGCRLTNLTPGGDGQGVPCSPEKAAKISAATKGRRHTVLTAEQYLAIGLKARGRKRAPGAIAKTAAALRGKPRPPEVVTKMAEGQRLAWERKGHTERMSRAHGGRPFVDQHGTRYASMGEAARALGTVAACIHRVLHGKRKHTKGFTFTYVEN